MTACRRPDAMNFAQVLRAEYERLELQIDQSQMCDVHDSDSEKSPRAETKLWRAAHEDPEGLSALCLSGGGIRSAAFSLGVLQQMHERGVLRNFHYLSTVSGGGFAGGWVTSATHNASDEELEQALEDALGEAGVRKFRENGRYLAPRVGLLSADLWSLLLAYLQGFLPNLLAIAPILVAVLSIPRVIYAWLVHGGLTILGGEPAGGFEHEQVLWLSRALAVFGPLSLVLALMAAVWLVRGMSRRWRPVGDLGAWSFGLLVMVTLVSTVAVAGPVWFDEFVVPVATGGVSAILLAAVRFSFGARDQVKIGRLTELLIPTVAACFVLSVCLGFAIILDSVVCDDLRENLLVLAVAPLLAIVLSIAYEPNATSLHHVYARRLLKSFVEPMAGVREGQPLYLHQLEKRRRLFPIINAAVNVTSGRDSKRGIPDRRAYPATLSPLHVGYDRHPTENDCKYGSATLVTGPDGKMTLARAMALSGAAVSSGMGFYTSTWYAFALTLLNMRLGLWQTLPPEPESSIWPRASARARAIVLRVQELLGMHGIGGKVVNVSDGGHFDNLGLYQMLRRRCRWIVIVDGGGDDRTKLTDLARAVRLARIDLGIEVTMHGLSLDGEHARPRPGVYKGHINYRKADKIGAKDGVLVYICPEVTEHSPIDVRSYANCHPKFPAESTGDQFFSEDQFESYRALGFSVVGQAIDLYELVKATIIAPEQLTKPSGLVPALAESAVLMQERGVFPTHAGIIAYKNEGGALEYLMVGSSNNKEWVFPKGHIEAGEDPRSAALREFSEETGFAVKTEDGKAPTLEPAFIDKFPRDGQEVRVAYYLLDGNRVEESRVTGPERRPVDWISAAGTRVGSDVERREMQGTHASLEMPDYATKLISRATEVIGRA